MEPSILDYYLGRLNSFRYLASDWNGNSPVPNDRAIVNAMFFLKEMDKLGYESLNKVVPTVVGGVGVTVYSKEYYKDHKKFYIEFHNSGRIFRMLAVSEEGGEMDIQQVNPSHFTIVLEEASTYLGF